MRLLSRLVSGFKRPHRCFGDNLRSESRELRETYPQYICKIHDIFYLRRESEKDPSRYMLIALDMDTFESLAENLDCCDGNRDTGSRLEGFEGTDLRGETALLNYYRIHTLGVWESDLELEDIEIVSEGFVKTDMDLEEDKSILRRLLDHLSYRYRI